MWQSQYSNCWKDRIHHFQCKYGPFRYKNYHCSTTHFANDYRQPLAFRCPHNGVIAGVGSTYSARRKDRRWDIEFNEPTAMAVLSVSYTCLQMLHLWWPYRWYLRETCHNAPHIILRKFLLVLQVYVCWTAVQSYFRSHTLSMSFTKSLTALLISAAKDWGEKWIATKREVYTLFQNGANKLFLFLYVN